MTDEKGAVPGATFRVTIRKTANGDYPEKWKLLYWFLGVFFLKNETVC